jgi:hypothetical protein
MATVTITEDDVERDRMGSLIHAWAANGRGDVVECPWHFYDMAEMSGKYHRWKEAGFAAGEGFATPVELRQAASRELRKGER